MVNRSIVVYGAAGHTGKFVVAELLRRGWTAVMAGRDARKLEDARARVPGATRSTEIRIGSTDDPSALDRALVGASAVVHCAGPFLETAAPVIEAALRARIPYLDVTAEQP